MKTIRFRTSEIMKDLLKKKGQEIFNLFLGKEKQI